MKNIKNIISFIIMSIVLIACEDKALENADWLKDPVFDNPMNLTLSNKELVLTGGNDTAEAITFTWTSGNDRGPGTTLKYFFRMDIVGNNFSEETALVEEIPEGIFTKTYTVGQLNSLILLKFKRPEGVISNLEVQIIARVDNSTQYQKPEIAASSFSAVTFSRPPLYMVGDAISGGWDYSIGKSLPEIIENKAYSYIGSFSVGSFKIIKTLASEFPSYDPVAGNMIVFNESSPRTEDNVFKVTQAGRHSLYIDIEEKIYNFTYAPYENIYMVGHAIDGIGWNIENAKPMNWDAKRGVFSYKGKFNGPEGIKNYEGFKLFFKQGDWGAPCLMPAAKSTKLIVDADAEPMYLNTTVSGDNKWDIETTGNYELIVDPAKMTIRLKKL